MLLTFYHRILKTLITLFALCASLAAEPISVVVSVPPQVTFVNRIGGERVQVISLVPANASPHTYDLRPGQLAALSKTKLYIANGLNFTPENVWIDRIRSINPNLTVINSSQNIDIHTHHNHADPHLWLSPQRCKIIVANIARALSQIDPPHASTYLQNSKNYSAEFDSLDTWIKNTLAHTNTRAFLVYHPAWTYFANDYNLTQLAIEHEGKDPTPRHLLHIIQKAKKNTLTTIITDPQTNIASAQTIARELNAHIVSLNPLAPDPIAHLKELTNTIALTPLSQAKEGKQMR